MPSPWLNNSSNSSSYINYSPFIKFMQTKRWNKKKHSSLTLHNLCPPLVYSSLIKKKHMLWSVVYVVDCHFVEEEKDLNIHLICLQYLACTYKHTHTHIQKNLALRSCVYLMKTIKTYKRDVWFLDSRSSSLN